MKKLMCSVLALLMAISPLSVFALTDTPVVPPGNTPVTLTATPLTFNATVPTGLPLDLAANGVVTPATEAFIINGSIGPIKVVGITTETVDGWKLTNYTDDFSTKKVNSKDIALQFNKDNVQSSGGITLTPQNWPTIEGNGSLRLDYQGKLASQSTDFTAATAAHVSFVLDWDNSINNPNDFLNLETSKDTLDIDETATLSVTQKEQSPITWSNSNPSVVELTETQGRSGITTKNIKAIGLGRSTISVQDELGNSASQDIVVIENELMGIKIVQQPTKTEYNENEIFNPEGMTLKTYYKLGNEHDLLDYTYDKTPIKLGQASVTISYTEKDKKVTVECPITVVVEDDNYVLATDADFSGTKDGEFRYIGTKKFVNVPHVIKGVPVTSYYNMFSGVTSAEGVKSTNKNITDMRQMFYGSSVKTLDISSLDTSNVTDMSGMFNGSWATTLDLSNFDTSKVTTMMNMFKDSYTTTLDLSSFDTSKVTTMMNMFYGSEATTLDISSFNTSNVTTMKEMFSDSKATTLDVSSFDTSKVTNMDGMFCASRAKTLDLSNFNTSNVTTMSGMFGNSQLDTLDLSTFDTSKVTDMSAMFFQSSFNTLNLSSFNTANVTNMKTMFMRNPLPTIDLSSFDTSKVTDMSYMFNTCYATTLDLSSFDISNVTDMSSMFEYSKATTGYARTRADANSFNATENKPAVLTFTTKEDKYIMATDADFSGTKNGEFKYIGTNKFVEVPHVIKGVPVTSFSYMFEKTSVEGVKSTNTNITDMSYMFWASNSTTLDVSNLDTSNVTNMGDMFRSSQATTLDLSSLDTSNVTSMNRMFSSSKSMTLDLSGFDTSNVTSMASMFDNSQATTLDLSNFDTSNVIKMGNMFFNSKATTLDVSNFNTSKVTNMSFMFASSKATTLDLSNFDTSNVEDMSNMFRSSEATELDLSNFDTSNVYYISNMFLASKATTGYARTQTDANTFNTSEGKPAALTFRVK